MSPMMIPMMSPMKPYRMLNFETSTVATTVQTYASTMVWNSVIPFTEQLLTAETQTMGTTTDMSSTLPDPDNPNWHEETTYESMTGKMLYTHANSGQRFNGRYGRSIENKKDFQNIPPDSMNSGAKPLAADFYLILIVILYWLNVLHLRNK